MKVSELIQRLQQFDEDLAVVVWEIEDRGLANRSVSEVKLSIEEWTGEKWVITHPFVRIS